MGRKKRRREGRQFEPIFARRSTEMFIGPTTRSAELCGVAVFAFLLYLQTLSFPLYLGTARRRTEVMRRVAAPRGRRSSLCWLSAPCARQH
jgi:hypothetical protein